MTFAILLLGVMIIGVMIIIAAIIVGLGLDGIAAAIDRITAKIPDTAVYTWTEEKEEHGDH